MAAAPAEIAIGFPRNARLRFVERDDVERNPPAESVEPARNGAVFRTVDDDEGLEQGRRGNPCLLCAVNGVRQRPGVGFLPRDRDQG